MHHLVILFIHLIAILTRLHEPGGVRSLVAESLLLKHQLMIVNRCRRRSPNLSSWDRILAGWMAVVRQIVVHHIKRISFSLAEVLRFGIAC
jgi:hypothetical protein